MANRLLYNQLETLERNLTAILVEFDCNGASTPTVTRGTGWAVARTGAGVFTITFTDSWPSAPFVVTGASLGTAGDLTIQSAGYVAATKVLTIRTMVGAVATDIAAAAGNKVQLLCLFLNK